MASNQDNTPPSIPPRGSDADGREMHVRSRRIRDMFSSIAPSYDRLNHLLSFSIDRSWRTRTVRRTLGESPSSDLRVLDLCAGTGDLSLAYAKEIERRGPTPGGSAPPLVVASDFSHAMLAIGAEKFGKRPSDPAEPTPVVCAEADALCLPFADNSFDVAAVAFGLRNLTDRVGGLAEMARVVRPGGRVAVLEFSMPRSWWLRPVYRLYLGGVLPFVGNLLTRSRAYGYLSETVDAFPPPEEVTAWFEQVGLTQVAAEPMTGGIAFLHTGVVP